MGIITLSYATQDMKVKQTIEEIENKKVRVSIYRIYSDGDIHELCFDTYAESLKDYMKNLIKYIEFEIKEIEKIKEFSITYSSKEGKITYKAQKDIRDALQQIYTKITSESPKKIYNLKRYYRR